MEGFNCLKDAEQLRGDSLLLTTKSQEVLVLTSSPLETWKTEPTMVSTSGVFFNLTHLD